MGEYTERWRTTHNWLARFGDDLLALRDTFAAAGAAEDLLSSKETEVARLDDRAASLSVEIEVQGRRLADQSTLIAAADADLLERRTKVDVEVNEYFMKRHAEADQEVTQAAAETRRKVEIDLVQINADIQNRTANRDALAGEVSVLVERAQTYDRLIAEKSERLKTIEARLAEVGKFALGASDG